MDSNWSHTIVSACFNWATSQKLQGDSAGAEAIFLKVLRSNPNYPDALLELANIRIEGKRFSEAAELLRKYVRVSSNPATGYYKLAMVEKNLHETGSRGTRPGPVSDSLQRRLLASILTTISSTTLIIARNSPLMHGPTGSG